MKIDSGLSNLPVGSFVELPRKAANQRHFVVQDESSLRQLLNWTNQQEYYLCNLVATDDRLLVDRAFKIYYILSGEENEIIILEYFIPNTAQHVAYHSVADIYPNAHPLEQEIHDMFGMIAIHPEEGASQPGFLLQGEIYPQDFFPLRRRRTLENLKMRLGKLFSINSKFADTLDVGQLPDALRKSFQNQDAPLTADATVEVAQASKKWVIDDVGMRYIIRNEKQNERQTLNVYGKFTPKNTIRLSVGMFIVPVGPIHAGVIEAGHFPFHVAGEVVEKLPLRLGYKHRGIEKLFETHYTLQNGWELAEKVSGNSSVAHAIAYCQAVENLAQIELDPAIYEWRALFLELERMYNHISDIGLLATGVAYEQAASSLATLRELFVHFINLPLSGNRFLRGLNQLGSVSPNLSVNLSDLYHTIEVITEEALEWGKKIMENQTCRERMLTTGVLKKLEARYATGPVARASGWLQHDFRLRHPSPAYASPDVQQCLQETLTHEETSSPRLAPVYMHDLNEDVFARLSIRVAELETSLYLVKNFIEKLSHSKNELKSTLLSETNLTKVPEMSMGLGYVEGWQGDVIYVIFKGMDNTIARCKVRDPSAFNWHIFPEAVRRKEDKANKKFLENILADFPLINKSFNLSYAGHDL